MRIEIEIEEAENGFIKDGINYNCLKTYYIYSDKGTLVDDVTIECTTSGMEPGASPSFQAQYDVAIEKAKKLDIEESKEDEENKVEIDSKFDKLNNGEPTSTFSTGNPVDPQEDMESNTGSSNNSIETSNSSSSNSTESSNSSTSSSTGTLKSSVSNLSTQGKALGTTAMETVGSGVMVASTIMGLKDTAEITAKLTEVALAAAVERATQALTEYGTKFIMLPTTIPTKISNATQERISKTKGDKDKNGNEYDPVKISIGDALKSLSNDIEDLTKLDAENLDLNIKNKKIDEIKEKLQKATLSAQEKLEKGNAAIQKIVSHVGEGVEWLQQNIDKEISRIDYNIRTELETAYNKAEISINTFCESEGDKIGTRIVKEYNNLIGKQAKKLDDEKKKAIKQAKIKSNAAIQKAKLQIFAMLGV